MISSLKSKNNSNILNSGPPNRPKFQNLYNLGFWRTPPPLSPFWQNTQNMHYFIDGFSQGLNCSVFAYLGSQLFKYVYQYQSTRQFHRKRFTGDPPPTPQQKCAKLQQQNCAKQTCANRIHLYSNAYIVVARQPVESESI